MCVYAYDILHLLGCVGYQEEVTAYWCDDNSDCNGDYKDYKGICNGSKTDCVAKGKEKCLSDPSCFGIMYHAGAKALKVCTSKRLVVKPERDWDVYMKCGNKSITILFNSL